MKEFKNMDNLKEDLFETLGKMFEPKREDEYHEVQILEAKQRLEEEAAWLEGKAYHCKVNGWLDDAEQWEAMAYIKREKIEEL